MSSAAAAISAGGVTYNLSGYLGGWEAPTDDADVTATFENSAGSSLGTATLSAVTDLDRLFSTEFLSRSASGDVPEGTTEIVVTVNFSYGEGNTTDGYVNNLDLTLDTPVTAPMLTPPASNVPRFSHVFFIFMENENENSSLFPYSILGDYIAGNSSAPYENNTLAPMGSLLTQMYATQHPSDPNYLAVTAGSTFNEDQDVSPGTVNEKNLSDELNAAGLSWEAYAQGMAGDCDLTTNDTAAGDYYDNDDDAFLDYADDSTPASYCDAHNVPLTRLSSDLASTSTTPAYSWIVANDYDDMELGGVSAGDSWLSTTLPEIFSSPAWTTQKSLLIVSWDEGYVKEYGSLFPNQIATYVVGSQGTVKAGYQSSEYYDDYSLLSTVEHALGLPPMTSNDEYAQPLSDVWAG